MHPKDAAGIANSVDPDQTAPLRAVWSGSALFAQTSLSENFTVMRISLFRTTAGFEEPCSGLQACMHTLHNILDLLDSVVHSLILN